MEQNYKIYDKEMLTIMEALAEWRHLLLRLLKFGQTIKIYNTSDNPRNLISDKLAGLQN